MYRQLTKIGWVLLVGVICAGSSDGPCSFGQSTGESVQLAQSGVSSPSTAAISAPPTPGRSPYTPFQSKRARLTYQGFWGIEGIRVSEASSGALLRVSYRIVDATKAKALHDERSTPYLIDESTGAVLKVPDMPKVGELRSKMTPVNGKEYWIAFSNKGLVKPGSRVDLVIGTFRANGLVVH